MLFLHIPSAMGSGLLCEVEVLEESGFSLPTKVRAYNLGEKKKAKGISELCSVRELMKVKGQVVLEKVCIARITLHVDLF